MRAILYPILAVAVLLGCSQTETVAIQSIANDWDAYAGRTIEFEGTHVHSQRDAESTSTSRMLNFILIEDASGQMDVWYNTIKTRCAPRLGTKVRVKGKVGRVDLINMDTGDSESRQAFIASTLSVRDEQPVSAGEVRLCRLSLREQETLAMEGPEALNELWLASGKATRTVVYD